MQTTATVVALSGAIATVEAERRSACEGCHKASNGECSVCSLLGGDRTISTQAYNSIGAEVGDVVLIESETGRMLWYAALVFLFPLLLGFLFWGVTALFTEQLVFQLAGGICGVVACLIGVFFYSKYHKGCDVKIVARVSKQQAKGTQPDAQA